MDLTALFSACLIAMAAVFTLLGLLAAVMRMITAVFPVRDAEIDSTVVAVVSTAVASIWPGARVTRIEEER